MAGLGDLPRLRASVTDGTPERSAPTAKMNGLPVTPIATGAGEWAAISSSAASSEAIPPGPKVDGLVWSCPLSMVISANSPDRPGQRQVADLGGGHDLVLEDS